MIGHSIHCPVKSLDVYQISPLKAYSQWYPLCFKGRNKQLVYKDLKENFSTSAFSVQVLIILQII